MQWDHNDHPNNIVCSYVDGKPRFVLLDYALAVGHHAGTKHEALRAAGWRRWEDEDGHTVEVRVPIPPHMDRYLLSEELETITKAIESFPAEKITEIVQRIPDDFMDPAERDVVEKGLAERKGLVRKHLQARPRPVSA